MKPLWQQQRRKRHETGNSSINDFYPSRLSLALAWVAACGLGALAQAQTVAAPAPQAASKNPPQRQKAVAINRDEEKLRQVGDGFEAMMLDMLYRQMQQSGALFEGGEGSPFAPSGAEKIYRAMRDDALMKQLAATRPLGYGDMALRQLKGESGVPRGALLKSRQRASSTTERVTAPGG